MNGEKPIPAQSFQGWVAVTVGSVHIWGFHIFTPGWSCISLVRNCEQLGSSLELPAPDQTAGVSSGQKNLCIATCCALIVWPPGCISPSRIHSSSRNLIAGILQWSLHEAALEVHWDILTAVQVQAVIGMRQLCIGSFTDCHYASRFNSVVEFIPIIYKSLRGIETGYLRNCLSPMAYLEYLAKWACSSPVN